MPNTNDEMLRALETVCSFGEDDFTKTASEAEFGELFDGTSDEEDTFLKLAADLNIAAESIDDEEETDDSESADEQEGEVSEVEETDDAGEAEEGIEDGAEDGAEVEASADNEGAEKLAYTILETRLGEMGVTTADYVGNYVANEKVASFIADKAEKLAAVQEVSPFKVADDIIMAMATKLNSDESDPS